MGPFPRHDPTSACGNDSDNMLSKDAKWVWKNLELFVGPLSNTLEFLTQDNKIAVLGKSLPAQWLPVRQDF